VAEPTSPIPDPAAAWRAWVEQSEQQWNAFLNHAMGTEQYGQSVGRLMETYVTMQKQLGGAMGRYLSALNLPSRADVLALGERLAGIEDRLAAIERALADSAAPSASGGHGVAPVTRPPRTRQPAARAAGTPPGAGA
jgi:hypothetical protein